MIDSGIEGSISSFATYSQPIEYKVNLVIPGALRDYIATHVVAALVGSGQGGMDPEHIAYLIADRMLQERNRKYPERTQE